MHVCLVSNEYPPAKHGGIGSVNYDLAEGLASAGHKVTVIGMYPPDEVKRLATLGDKLTPGEKSGQVRVLRLPEQAENLHFRFRTWWNRWRLKRCLEREHRREKFDLLEYSDFMGWLPWGGPKGIPSVIRIHGNDILFDAEGGQKGDPYEHQLDLKTLQAADYWLGVSAFALRRISELTGVTRPGGVIYNAVDTEQFAPQPELPVEKGLIVFVNFIKPRKGIAELMDAVNLLFPKHPDAHLVVIGGDTGQKVDGRTYTERVKARLNPEVAGRVVFAGRRDRYKEVLPLLHKAQVCCYPSHVETFGISPVEAMAVGKPTIYSLTGPGPEVLEDGVSGLLCNPKDPQDIANKLEKLLTDHAYAAKLAQAGRQRVVERFARSDWVPRNLAFFEKCLREYRAS